MPTDVTRASVHRCLDLCSLLTPPDARETEPETDSSRRVGTCRVSQTPGPPSTGGRVSWTLGP